MKHIHVEQIQQTHGTKQSYALNKIYKLKEENVYP